MRRFAAAVVLLVVACRSGEVPPEGTGGDDAAAAAPADAAAARPDLTAPPPASAVGDPCARDADCMTGECVTEAEAAAFRGGYCTIRDCDRRDVACPTGSRCLPVEGPLVICLKECATDSNVEECRAGYACCSGPGPLRERGGCAPEGGFFCSQR